MFGISPLGWVHTLGSLPAIPLALYMFLRYGRIVPASRAGRLYLLFMLIGALTTFLVALYRNAAAQPVSLSADGASGERDPAPCSRRPPCGERLAIAAIARGPGGIAGSSGPGRHAAVHRSRPSQRPAALNVPDAPSAASAAASRHGPKSFHSGRNDPRSAKRACPLF